MSFADLIDSIIGSICERLTGHRFRTWKQAGGFWVGGEWHQPRFMDGTCRWCRQRFFRPMPPDTGAMSSE